MLRAFRTTGVSIGEDYFNYLPFTISARDVTHNRFRSLRALANDSKYASNMLRECYSYWLDVDSRIFLEALLLSFENDQLLRLRNFKADMLNCYSSHFFDVSELKKSMMTHIFINSLKDEDVREWFLKVQSLDINSLLYMINGNSRINTAVQTLDAIKERAEARYLMFTTVPASSMKNGLSRKERILYELGLKEAALATKIAQLQLQYDDKLNKTSASFLSEWKLMLQQQPVSKFNVSLTREEEDDLLLQMDNLPSKSLSDSALDAIYDKRDGED